VDAAGGRRGAGARARARRAPGRGAIRLRHGPRALPWDEAEVTPSRACLGQLYFHVPGGTKYGQYWLNVKFAESVVRVPFRLFTKEEEKTLSKNYSSIKKQVDEAFRKKTQKGS